jgi:SAM-dependent methyltransferase
MCSGANLTRPIVALIVPEGDTMADDRYQLSNAYKLGNPDETRKFYEGWATGYEAEVSGNGYITPQRCAEALARHAAAPWAPIMDLACGTGISGLALTAAGFECIDGYDFSQAMLDQAALKGIYRSLGLADMSKPLEIAEDIYQNAAAIGCITPEYMPPTVLDEILSKLPQGGCLVFSVNDHSAADGTVVGRIMTLIDCGAGELMFKEYGDHLPAIGLKSTVYVLKKR